MHVLAVLWYGFEMLVYWVWWAISGKELDFYQRASYALWVFWIGITLIILINIWK